VGGFRERERAEGEGDERNPDQVVVGATPITSHPAGGAISLRATRCYGWWHHCFAGDVGYERDRKIPTPSEPVGAFQRVAPEKDDHLKRGNIKG
jgi:hypothetical protein